jgi:hypothetical protein
MHGEDDCALAYVNQPKALVAGEGYLVVITPIIPAKRMTNVMDGNIGKYAYKGGAQQLEGNAEEVDLGDS